MNKLLVIFTIFMCTLVTSQSFAGNKVVDADITYWVKDALRHDPRVDASEITASTKEGIVMEEPNSTLTGPVAPAVSADGIAYCGLYCEECPFHCEMRKAICYAVENSQPIVDISGF